jgi:hypothetical protein
VGVLQHAGMVAEVAMPVVLRIGPYRFLFYASDQHEPPHVHVERDCATAKFWLDPVRLESNKGFTAAELRKVRRLVEDNEAALLEEWNEFFRRAN